MVIFILFLLFFNCLSSKKPNILFILLDDCGWNDVGYNNGSDVLTPNIDRLASNGLILNEYYAQRQCTMTRAALLTGRYPHRYGLHGGVIGSANAYGLPTSETLISEELKAVGYNTYLIGKLSWE